VLGTITITTTGPNDEIFHLTYVIERSDPIRKSVGWPKHALTGVAVVVVLCGHG
jgi:hypothetical protein